MWACDRLTEDADFARKIVAFRAQKMRTHTWLCIHLNNAGMWACDRLTEDADFDKKKIFSNEAHFDLGGYVNKQNCHIWATENQNESLLGANFGPEA